MTCFDWCHQHWVVERIMECTRDRNLDVWMEVGKLSSVYVDCVNAFARSM
jgi:S-formylglutathione hydrolase FrmB